MNRHSAMAAMLTVLTMLLMTATATAASATTSAISAVTLTSTVNPNNTFTLTATADGPVSGSGLVLAIYDTTTNVRLATCYSGCANGDTSLSVTTVPQAATSALSAGPHTYLAVVGSSSSSYPPSSVTAVSAPVTESGWAVELVPTGATASTLTLTATANYHLGFSGYTLAVFDVTTGVRLAFCYGSGGSSACPGGNVLTVTTVPKATTGELSSVAHQYLGVVAGSTSVYPPQNVAAESATFTANPWEVSLTSTPNSDKTFTLTATSNYQVGLSGYTMAVFDTTTGRRLAFCYGTGSSACAAGTTLSVKTVPQGSTSELSAVPHSYVAVVANGTATYPPVNQAAASAPLEAAPWSVSLASSLNSNGTMTLRATSSYNVGASSYILAIYDLTTGSRVSNGFCYGSGSARCVNGDSLEKVIGAAAVSHEFVAVVSDSSAAYPPVNVAAQSA